MLVKSYYYTCKGDKPGIYYKNCTEFKQIVFHGRKTTFVKIVVDESEMFELYTYLSKNHPTYSLCRVKVLK